MTIKPLLPTVKAFYVADQPKESSEPESNENPTGNPLVHALIERLTLTDLSERKFDIIILVSNSRLSRQETTAKSPSVPLSSPKG
jgi:hypothetical protein